MRTHQLTGLRFGKLIVKGAAENTNAHRQGLVLCKCDCRAYRIVRANHLLTGNTKSCGCLRRRQWAGGLHIAYSSEGAA
jgi:hypothetical protein